MNPTKNIKDCSAIDDLLDLPEVSKKTKSKKIKTQKPISLERNEFREI